MALSFSRSTQPPRHWSPKVGTTADAARVFFPDHVVVTSMNGAKAASRTDWSPLAGRHVVVWPDADAAGREYANSIVRLAKDAGSTSVAVVAVPQTWPEGWDLADPLPTNVAVEDLQRMLSSAVAAAEPKSCDPLPLVRPPPLLDPFQRTRSVPVGARSFAISRDCAAPLAMCANSLLAAAALAAQPHVNVELPFGSWRN